jgi:hypothetical protein
MPLKTLGPIGPRAVGERVKECKSSEKFYEWRHFKINPFRGGAALHQPEPPHLLLHNILKLTLFM